MPQDVARLVLGSDFASFCPIFALWAKMGQKGVFHLFLTYFFSKIASENEKYLRFFKKIFRILKEDRILAQKTTFLGHFEDHPVSGKVPFEFGGG